MDEQFERSHCFIFKSLNPCCIVQAIYMSCTVRVRFPPLRGMFPDTELCGAGTRRPHTIPAMGIQAWSTVSQFCWALSCMQSSAIYLMWRTSKFEILRHVTATKILEQEHELYRLHVDNLHYTRTRFICIKREGSRFFVLSSSQQVVIAPRIPPTSQRMKSLLDLFTGL